MSTLTLGGVTLDNSMRWVEMHQPQDVAQQVEYTLGGGVVITAAAAVAGKNITIQSLEDQGLLTLDKVEALLELANSAGAVAELNFNGTIYNVMFRHDEAPAFIAEPLVTRVEPMAGDYFKCVIKLITV